MHILAIQTPLMTFVVKFIHIGPHEIIFQFFEWKNFLITFPKFWQMTSFLPPKMREFGSFSPKMTYFDQIDPINDIFDQIYVHKPDWNNF